MTDECREKKDADALARAVKWREVTDCHDCNVRPSPRLKKKTNPGDHRRAADRKQSRYDDEGYFNIGLPAPFPPTKTTSPNSLRGLQRATKKPPSRRQGECPGLADLNLLRRV